MSTAVPVSALFVSIASIPPTPLALRPLLRRRPDPGQGRALEVLGHAIEYLVDMRLWEEHASPGDGEALRILMTCSRSVFGECVPIVPVRERFLRWIRRAPKSTRAES